MLRGTLLIEIPVNSQINQLENNWVGIFTWAIKCCSPIKTIMMPEGKAWVHVVSSGNNVSAKAGVLCYYIFINFKSSLPCDYRNQLLLQIEVVDRTEHVHRRASQGCTHVPRSLDVMCMYICQKSSLWILQIRLSVKLYLRHDLISKIPFIGGREMAQKLRV